MMRNIVLLLFAVTTVDIVIAFTVTFLPTKRWRRSSSSSRIYESSPPNDGDDSSEKGLSLNNLEMQMSNLESKYPTSESDYLAAAKKRALEQRESVNGGGSDQDWEQIAEEKRQQMGGDIDDWENSLKEAGNIDSQILIPAGSDDDVDYGQSSGEGGGGEPKLLLASGDTITSSNSNNNNNGGDGEEEPKLLLF